MADQSSSSPRHMSDDHDRPSMLHRNGNGSHAPRTSSGGVFSVASLCSPDIPSRSTPHSPDKAAAAHSELNGNGASSSSSSTITSPQHQHEAQYQASGPHGQSASKQAMEADDGTDGSSVILVEGQTTVDEGEGTSDDDGEAGAQATEGGPEDDEGEGEDEEDDDDDDEEDDEDDDDDDEEDDDDGDDVSTASHERPAQGADEDAAKKDADGDAVMVTASDGAAAKDKDGSAPEGPAAAATSSPAPNVLTVKKKQKRKQREPSVDVALPKGPPPLPTVRLQVKFSRSSYIVNVPDKLHDKLKQDKHPWAEWYETRDAGPSSTGGPAASTSSNAQSPPQPPEPESLGDLGPFAHLLNKYPIGETAGQPKRRKKRRKDVEEYDVNDPFVDDSELHVDEPTHSAKPVSQGFYVALGDIELEKLQKKRAKAGEGASPSAPSTSSGGVIGGAGSGGGGAGAPPSYLINGTQLEVSNRMLQLRAREKGMTDEPSTDPATLPDDAIGLVDAAAQMKQAGSRDSPIKVDDEPSSSAASSAKKKSYPTKPVPRLLAAELQHIKNLVASEDFSVKHKFPPGLRPPLRKAARVALELGEYNENFFNYLPAIFPYNRFTMSKLIKRDFYEDHVGMLKKKQDELYDDLREAVQEALPAHRADYEEQMQKWRAAGGRAGAASTSTSAPPADEAGAADTNGTTTPAGADGEAGGAKPTEGEDETGGAAGAGADKGAGSDAPIKKWRWTERMREDVFQIILLENGLTELKIDKGKLENASEHVSDLNQRKAAYKRMLDSWPEGEDWTTTTAISREFSTIKQKHKHQNEAMASG